MLPLIIMGLAIGALWLNNSMTRSSVSAASPDANTTAFLATLRHSEGTDQYADPYLTYYGGAQFTGTTDHPVLTGEEQPVAGPNGSTTAAGAYQIEVTTWQDLGGAAHYGDFSQTSQDQAALDLIERRGATSAMTSGDFATAIGLLGKEWASLPGSPYGQPTNTLADLQSYYEGQGGTVAA